MVLLFWHMPWNRAWQPDDHGCDGNPAGAGCGRPVRHRAGLVGGGGSILAWPLLVYVVG
jgi:hypothetical protein